MNPLRAYKRGLYRLYDKRVSGIGLAAFRIAFTSVIFGEVFQLFYFRDLVFEGRTTSTVPMFCAWLPVLLCLWLGLYTRTAAIANYVLVLCTFSVFSPQWEYHHDYTVIGAGFLMMFLPISKRLSLDQLRERIKYSTPQKEFIPDGSVPALYYYVTVFIGIGLIYFDSFFWKIWSPMWREGLAVWRPSSLPMTSYLDMTWLLDRKWLVMGMNYLVMLIEATLIFLMWFKPFRIPLFIVGVGFHLGIAIAFPIPWFALGMLSLFLLLMPFAWYRSVHRAIQCPKPKLRIFYDDNCGLCNRGKIIGKHFDIRGALEFRGVAEFAAAQPELAKIDREELLRTMYSVDQRGRVAEGVDTYRKMFFAMGYTIPLGVLLALPGISHIARPVYAFVAGQRLRTGPAACDVAAAPLPADPDETRLFSGLGTKDLKIAFLGLLMVLLFLSQSIRTTFDTPMFRHAWESIGVGEQSRSIRAKLDPYVVFARRTFGLHIHSIFLESMYEDFNHAVRIVYIDHDTPDRREIAVPLNQEDGQAGIYARNRNWVVWNWRMNNPHPDMGRLNHYLMRYTEFWMAKHHISRDSAEFRVKVKYIDPIGPWEKGFLRRQLQRPWVNFATVKWYRGEFHSELPHMDIEAVGPEGLPEVTPKPSAPPRRSEPSHD